MQIGHTSSKLHDLYHSLHSKRSRMKSFPAFWPCVHWNESKNPAKQGGGGRVFALTPIYAQSECGKALCNGTLANQAIRITHIHVTGQAAYISWV